MHFYSKYFGTISNFVFISQSGAGTLSFYRQPINMNLIIGIYDIISMLVVVFERVFLSEKNLLTFRLRKIAIFWWPPAIWQCQSVNFLKLLNQSTKWKSLNRMHQIEFTKLNLVHIVRSLDLARALVWYRALFNRVTWTLDLFSLKVRLSLKSFKLKSLTYWIWEVR